MNDRDHDKQAGLIDDEHGELFCRRTPGEREREREMKKEGRSVTDRLEGTDERSVISFASDLAINPSDSTSRSLDT